MLARWASVVERAALPVALALAVLVAAAGAESIGVAGKLSSSGDQFFDYRSESWQVAQDNDAQGGPALLPSLLVAVKDPTAARMGQARTDLEAMGALLVLDQAAFNLGTVARAPSLTSPLRSADGQVAGVAVYRGASSIPAQEMAAALRTIPGVQVGGSELASAERADSVGPDLVRAELIAFPLLFLLSLVLFRSPIGALLPLVVGASTIAIVLFGLRAAATQTELSHYSLNVVTGLSLGLSIDYALLMLWRYREEVEQHGHGALARSLMLRRSGRTVVQSALTVAGVLACLALFPVPFLRSIGITGALTAMVAGAVAVLVIPVLLTLLGGRVDALTPARWRAGTSLRADRSMTGFWYRVAHRSTARPGVTVVATSALLVLLAWPASTMQLGGLSSADVPNGSEVSKVAHLFADNFPVDVEQPAVVLVKGQSGTQIAGSAQRLGNVPGVAAVARPTQLAGGSYRIDVMLKRGADVGQFTSRARALSLPGETAVGGISVSFADQRSAIAERAPVVAAVIALVVLVLLFFVTGSAILPLKALVMTGLTVMGALGVMVAIFQNGWFEGALNYTSTGTFDLTVPVLVGAFGAALSIDYSIILLARIRESRAETGGDDREAIALGLDRTGRVVSASAALFCVAFLAFALVRLTLIKEIGIGTAAAVVIDVTLVRALLVPALMALLGRANWWAPGALRRRLRD